MEEAVALLAAEKCTNAAVAAAAGTAAAVPREPVTAAVTTMGNGGALGPVMADAFVADRAAVATADAMAAVAVAVAETNDIPVTGGNLARGYAAGCSTRSHS